TRPRCAPEPGRRRRRAGRSGPGLRGSERGVARTCGSFRQVRQMVMTPPATLLRAARREPGGPQGDVGRSDWVPMPLRGMRAWLATWGLAVVRGRSMQPTLYDGDRLLVRHGAVPRDGALVVVRLPDGVV